MDNTTATGTNVTPLNLIASTDAPDTHAFDFETESLAALSAIIEQLDEKAQRRVVAYLSDRFGAPTLDEMISEAVYTRGAYQL